MPDPLPAGPGLHLPAATRSVEFISDLHLSPELPRTVAAFKAYLQDCRADALFILGDLFEAWVGDDALTQPFEADCADALAATAGRLPVYLMHGNRDFLLGARFFEQTGCLPLPDPQTVYALDQAVVLSHGDSLCLDDLAYQAFRAQVRAPAWQQAFLARSLPERLAIAAQMRAVSREHHGQHDPVTHADVSPALAGRWLAEAGSATLIHGHTHRPGSERRSEGWTRHVLSDWDLDHGPAFRAEALRWTADGFERLNLTPPAR